MFNKSFAAFSVLAVALLSATPAGAQQKQEQIKETYQGNIFRPAEEKPSDKLIAGLKVPTRLQSFAVRRRSRKAADDGSGFEWRRLCDPA